MAKENFKIDEYLFKKFIGTDNFGYENFLTYKDNNIFFGKAVERNKVENTEELDILKKEILALEFLSHKNIIKLEKILKSRKKLYLITEYYNGGTIKENIEKYKIKYGKPFSEKITQHIIKQLFDVVNYLQDKKYLRYDLTIDNIYLNYYSEEAKNNLDIFHSDIKLTNFRTVKYDNKIDIRAGFREGDPKKVKISWQIDLFFICYYLFTCDLSFNYNNEDDLIKNEIIIKIPVFSLSSEAISLLIRLWIKYINKKMNTVELLDYPFVQKYYNDFTDFDKKIGSYFIRDGNLTFNIKDTDQNKFIIFLLNVG